MASNSWFPIPSDSHFSLANIPFGIITYPSHDIPRPAVAIGENALDLSIFSQAYGFASLPSIQPHSAVFRQTTLNDFAALGRPIHGQVRRYLQEIFDKDTKLPHILKDNPKLQKSCLQELRSVKTHLPLHIGDYTDFYAGRNHAQNCGELFRAVADALPPNYTHLPIGYHGRASSVVVSGTPIHRPRGQIKPTATDQSPTFAESQKLDMELELGAFIGRANAMGQPVPVEKAEENLFGFVLLNDLSARDIQMWEMAPLGPFNSKNFGTIISPWVVLADALEPFKTKGLENETRLLPYLQQKNRDKVYDINLEVTLTSTLLHPSRNPQNQSNNNKSREQLL